ncbi:MAG: IS1182 family transposase [Candidatus Aenigmarchaeota archaeon]|nr:IS1182 family transposase [Candidatus Aenigmarchaeota archaeon]
MFYYVRMEEVVPENHLLRLVDRHIDLNFIREKVKHLYSHTGRPSIDPEILLRMLLIGYLYGITSERRLCEEVKMHIGYRWFVGLNLEDKIPDHSTFSKNRHERFSENNIFQEIFDEIVNQCITKGLLTGKHLTVDSTYIKANASFKSLEPIVVDITTKEYIEKVTEENPVNNEPWEPGVDYPHRGQKISNNTHRSKTDPDARLSRKSFRATTDLYYSATYMMDNKSRIVVGTDIGKPNLRTDCEKALTQLRRIRWRYKLNPESLGADKGYAAGEFLHNVINENIEPHIPIFEYQKHNHKGIYPREEFKYDTTKDIVICPEGKELNYWGIHKHSRQYVYRARKKDCLVCPKKAECTKDTARSVGYHIYEESINKAKQLNKTTTYRISQRMRKRIEELFGEAKEFMGLRRAKFRRMKFVKEQILMTAAAQNIKRMVKLLSGKGSKAPAMARQRPLILSFVNDLLKILAWPPLESAENLYFGEKCPLET